MLGICLCESNEYLVLGCQVLSNDIHNFTMFLHVLINEGVLIYTKVTNQNFGNVVITDLLSETGQQHTPLLFHLVNFSQ